ncbi:SDR family oxidoreductase [Neptunomonas sp. XY-337]|uniref:SDR family oxidoreductase n=1 Tax=Neptunomonas sp. XY-337 TaxID=2561897 RepID=UPI0010AB4A95|nr:SDR family oxidoreductase [Neptunomonas sp. XY-337]
MIAVTGANGQLGQHVIQSLLKTTPAADIVALVRDPAKAEHLKSLGVTVRTADYNQSATLGDALAGVTKLLLISGSEVGQRVPQHQAVIDAAKNANLELFVYTSILKADTSPLMLAQEHKETEARIKASGLPAVILRNGWYTENYTQSVPGILQAGAVAGAAAQGRFSTAARKDYAEAAAAVLTSEQSGKEIPYSNMPKEEFAALLVNIGLPEGFAGALADAEDHASRGWLEDNSQTLSQLLGRNTTPLSKSISEALR